MSKQLAKWESELLNPALSLTSVVMTFDEQSNVCVIPFDHYKQQLQALNEKGEQAKREYLNKAKEQRRKQRDVFGNKKAMSALTHLFVWAVNAGEVDYYEAIPPNEQRNLLDWFYSDAQAGIKRAEARKKRYDLINNAYSIAQNTLLSFRKRNGIPNEKRLSDAQAKEVWEQIKKFKRWKNLVNQSIKHRNPIQPKTPFMWQKEHTRLRAGVNSRWREEYNTKKLEDTCAK